MKEKAEKIFLAPYIKGGSLSENVSEHAVPDA
jgi:hypothetical protein